MGLVSISVDAGIGCVEKTPLPRIPVEMERWIEGGQVMAEEKQLNKGWLLPSSWAPRLLSSRSTLILGGHFAVPLDS
jgi:hypothetical protein